MKWSYRLLEEHERRVFRPLSVFAGPFMLEAAEAVAGPGAGPVVLYLPRAAAGGRARPMVVPAGRLASQYPLLREADRARRTGQ